METAPRVVLVTGVPSFAARHLLLHMLKVEPDSQYFIVVPDHLRARLDQRIGGPLPPQVTVLEGDTTAMDLGLSGEEFTDLRNSVTDIYHMASIYWLGVDYQEARKVNVKGTLNMLETAREMRHLNRFNHFSTAFVAGNRTGLVYERELAAGQKFRNAFEQTKFEAEEIIKRWHDNLPITVYRPSIIIGDSTHGEIDDNRMDGPYPLMKAMLSAPPDFAIPLPGKGDKPLNLVPIDWVCETLYQLSIVPHTEGRTYHLTDPHPLSARKVFELVAEAAGRPLPRGRLPYRMSRAMLKMPIIEKMFRRHRQFLDDFNQLTIFDSTNTSIALGPTGRACPAFDLYVSQIVEYLETHG